MEGNDVEAGAASPPAVDLIPDPTGFTGGEEREGREGRREEKKPPLPPGASTIVEGAARIVYAGKDAVFYNKAQIMNRDVSICVLNGYVQDLALPPAGEEIVKGETAYQKRVRKAWRRRALAGEPVPPEIKAWLDDRSKQKGEPSNASLHPGPSAAPAQENVDACVPPPSIRVLEALSASGLRSVRYAKEVHGIDTLVVNDFDSAAVESIKLNLVQNGLAPVDAQSGVAASHLVRPITFATEPSPRQIIPSQADAIELMYRHKESTADPTDGADVSLTFDVIDLDPYGSASTFLDTAVQAVTDGGLLCVTCTDMAVLAGNHLDACHGKYGSIPVRARHYNEQALRILLATIETAATRHRRVIRPLVSLSMDFYVRVFVKVHTSAKECNTAPTRLGHLLQCSACDSFWIWPQGKWPSKAGIEKGSSSDEAKAHKASVPDRGLPTAFDSRKDAILAGISGNKPLHVHANFAPPPFTGCPHCDRPIHMGGPIWIDPIHDFDFVKRVHDIAEKRFGKDGRGIPEARVSPLCFYNLQSAAPRPDNDGGSNGVDTVASARRRVLGILRGVLDELPDVPLYYEISTVLSRIHLRPAMHQYFIQAIKNAGFRVSGSHAAKDALKTDAPAGFIWDVLRAWEARPGNHVAAHHKEAPHALAGAILGKPASVPTLTVTFPSEAEARAAAATAKREGPKHVPNPGSEWGPGSRASSGKAAAVAAGVSVSNALRSKPPARRKTRPAQEEAPEVLGPEDGEERLEKRPRVESINPVS